ncbi:Oidioi.mRNA.OKI2018_I69.PAR.g9401.t1.cds [Oikopleura dioica]|uniref:Oidioi.mRNA.OKI2018_I69.PAR.g9401.t1.cds n=1 Tax=Oikopleura dioica TaxID=34765 RepID=A0ABN7RKB8_OIKDI|nr:Oidioi.mRNA.OKI2018_I69.PAR.g9401.t1.cds [Oikopleura dioica]
MKSQQTSESLRKASTESLKDFPIAQAPMIFGREEDKFSKETFGYISAAIVVALLLFFVLILKRIATLDDTFCGCFFCKLGNHSFCPGENEEFLNMSTCSIVFYGLF